MKITEIACGQSHSLLKTNEGFVYSTGSNLNGELGLGTTESEHEFRKIRDIKNVMQIAAGTHSGAVDCDGQIYIWGQGVFGKYLSPLKISNRDDLGYFDSISISYGFGVAKSKHGKVYAWGLNSNGQLGQGDTGNRSFLTPVSNLHDFGIVNSVAAGNHFVISFMEKLHPERPL